MIEVADVDLGHVMVAAEYLSHCEKTLHLEVAVLDALVRLPKFDMSSLVGTLTGDRKEGRPMTICRVWRKHTDRPNVEVMLQSLAASFPLLAARLEP